MVKLDSRITDRQFLSRCKEGDEDAFNMVYNLLREPLVRFIYKIIRSRNDAEDICQDTFAALWRQHDTIDPDKKLNGLIFLIARRITCKYIRKIQHLEDLDADAEPDYDLSLSPEEIILSQEMEMMVRYAIDKLSPQTGRIYNLHLTEGLSYQEIADRLDINTDNVKAKIHLARAKIREIIMSAILLLMA